MKKALRWMLWILGGVAALVCLVGLCGLLLPPAIEGHAAIVIARPPEQVWNFLADHESLPSWSHEAGEVKILNQNPVTWQTKAADGTTLVFEDVVREPAHELVTKTIASNQAFAGTWRFKFEPIPEGSRVSVHSTTEFQNPFLRVIGHLLFGSAEDRRSLAKAKQALESR